MAESSVLYNGQKIIPAPLVNISREYRQTEAHRQLGPAFSISLVGKLVSYKGSPNSEGTFHTASGYPSDESLTYDEKLMSILRKQEALRNLFATDGLTLEIQPADASPPLKCNPRTLRINFPQGQWHDICDYEITLECDSVSGLSNETGSDAGLERVSEEWNMERVDERQQVFRLTHSLSANGRRRYDETGAITLEGWEVARQWVLDRMGINATRMQCPGVLDLSDEAAYDYARVQRLDEFAGTFGVVETWLIWDADGEAAAREEFTISHQVDEVGRSRVRIEGNIQGLEVRNNTSYTLTSTRWANANSKWTTNVYPNILTRCQTQTGMILHPTPTAQQVGYNELNGVINYSFEFDDRPSFAIAGAISEVVNVTENHPSDVFASIPVLGRAIGPVLQSIDTVTQRQRSISLEVQLPASRIGYTPTQPSTGAIMLLYYPSPFTQIFVSQDTEAWSPYTGRYSRNLILVYQ